MIKSHPSLFLLKSNYWDEVSLEPAEILPIKQNMEILKIAILEFCRKTKGELFDSVEVLKVLYPQDWEHFKTELKAAAVELSRDGKILLFQDGQLITDKLVSEHEFEIRLNPNQKI